MSDDPRLPAASALLSENGLRATVAAEGPDSEIAAIQVPEAEWERLLSAENAALLEGIRALGFRYVALDLLPGDP